MEHILLGLAEIVLVLGGISIFLVTAFLLSLGAAAKTIARMFGFGRQEPARLSEADLLRQRLLDAQATAYESALASEKAIQQLQQRLHALETERGPGFAPLRR